MYTGFMEAIRTARIGKILGPALLKNSFPKQAHSSS